MFCPYNILVSKQEKSLQTIASIQDKQFILEKKIQFYRNTVAQYINKVIVNKKRSIIVIFLVAFKKAVFFVYNDFTFSKDEFVSSITIGKISGSGPIIVPFCGPNSVLRSNFRFVVLLQDGASPDVAFPPLEERRFGGGATDAALARNGIFDLGLGGGAVVARQRHRHHFVDVDVAALACFGEVHGLEVEEVEGGAATLTLVQVHRRLVDASRARRHDRDLLQGLLIASPSQSWSTVTPGLEFAFHTAAFRLGIRKLLLDVTE